MAKDSYGLAASIRSLLSLTQESTEYAYADIKENILYTLSPQLLNILLTDHTTHRNIVWATDSYQHLGSGFQAEDEILISSITGVNGNVIVPRALKSRATQQQRRREMAEVSTPAWICNKQNNLIDTAWFGREGVFNIEVDTRRLIDQKECNPDVEHSWIVTKDPIVFPEGRSWRDYVNENRMEITCGEAPYLVSLYDCNTAEYIPIDQRIGLLDRKLRIVGENTSTSAEWLRWAQAAYKSIYGFEWQGDSLLLARESLLYSFIEYYMEKFGKIPQLKSILYIAYIISWNIWQMDGLKGVLPNSCGERRTVVYNLFGETETISPCEGCKSGDIKKHNGIYALIKDWGAPKDKQKIRFIDLIK